MRFVLPLVILMFYGCAPEVRDVEEAELRDIYVKKAKSRIESGDKEEAIELLEQAIIRKPLNATAHLQLAMLYDSSATNFLKAIYHYQRYLELRPNAEKRGMVKDLMKKAELNYLATFSSQYKELEKEIASLKEENVKLKMELAALSVPKKESIKNTGTLQSPLESKDLISSVEDKLPVQTDNQAVIGESKKSDLTKPIQKPSSEKAAVQQPSVPAGATTYVVQQGDTLSKIAARFYQNPRLWKKIYEANKSVLGNNDKLKKGQVLVIPK